MIVTGEVETSTEKACLECAQMIPAAASKCSKCGSYQDWRRHVPFGQATLALAIAVIALGGYFVGSGRVIVNSVSGLISAKGFDVGIAAVRIGEEKASFFVTNRSDKTIAVKGAKCGVFLLVVGARRKSPT